MSGRPVIPPSLRLLCESVRRRGGRALLVGGAVRDGLLGLPLKDYDLEVFGLEWTELEDTLRASGRVDAVGRAFGVLKVSGLAEIDGAVDVALPRRDSKVGPGHRGIAAHGDPHLSIAEAARRRDFTINALLFDPLTQELLDPHGGQRDLASRLLRAVDALTFGEDPLRALRALQFAARFELTVEAETARLCATLPLAELPAERVFGEIEKLLLKARQPSRGLALMHAWGLLPSLAAELVPLAATPQDPGWHPEGDVWTHTLLVVDQAATMCSDLDRPRALALMLAALCHDLGKPATTRLEEGRLRSRGHEEAGVAPTESLLDRWRVHSLLGYDVRSQAVALVAHHLKPGQLYDNRARVSDGAIRRLAGKCDPDLLYRVARADCMGRLGEFEPVAMEWFQGRVRALNAQRLPVALLQGRDLLALGLPPGPEVGRVLKAIYERQLDGEITDAAGALSAAREMLAARESTSDREPPTGAADPGGLDSPHRE